MCFYVWCKVYSTFMYGAKFIPLLCMVQSLFHFYVWCKVYSTFYKPVVIKKYIFIKEALVKIKQIIRALPKNRGRGQKGLAFIFYVPWNFKVSEYL